MKTLSKTFLIRLLALSACGMSSFVFAQTNAGANSAEFNIKLAQDGSTVLFVPSELLDTRQLQSNEPQTIVPIVDRAINNLGVGLYAITSGLEQPVVNTSFGLEARMQSGSAQISLGAISQRDSNASGQFSKVCNASNLLELGKINGHCLSQANLETNLPGRLDSAQISFDHFGQISSQKLYFGYNKFSPYHYQNEYASRLDAWAPLRPLAPQIEISDSFSSEPITNKVMGGSSSWILSPDTVLTLSAQHEQTKDPMLQIYPNSNGSIKSNALGLGLVRGTLSGSVIGRVLSRETKNGAPPIRSQGIDLGVTWKTPWRGALTVGAENIVSRTKDAESASKVDSSVDRTPYVRYEQDL